MAYEEAKGVGYPSISEDERTYWLEHHQANVSLGGMSSPVEYTETDLTELKNIFNQVLIPMIPELSLPLASKKRRCALMQLAHRVMQFALNDASLSASLCYGDQDFLANGDIDFSEGLGEAPVTADIFSQAMELYPLHQQVIMQELSNVLRGQITNLLNSGEFFDVNYAVYITDQDIPQFDAEGKLQADRISAQYTSPNHAANSYRVTRMFALPIKLNLKGIVDSIQNADPDFIDNLEKIKDLLTGMIYADPDFIDNLEKIKDLLMGMIYEDEIWLENKIAANRRHLLERTRIIRWIDGLAKIDVEVIAFILQVSFVDWDIAVALARLLAVVLMICGICRLIMIRTVEQQMQIAREFINKFSGSFDTPGYLSLSDDDKDIMLTRLAERVQTILQLVREREKLIARYYPSEN